MKRYKVNLQIKSEQVRLISEKGENVGIVTANEALKQAQDKGLDLIEIAENAVPPVCKIADYRKFLYDEKQKEEASLKKTHKVETKEFRFGPNIGAHDLEKKVDRARKFILNKDKVKFTIQFKGREKAHPEVGMEKINNIIKVLDDVAKVESEAQMKGSFLTVGLTGK